MVPVTAKHLSAIPVAPEMLEAIQQDNQKRLASYQAQGVAVNIPVAPMPLIEMLIETLIGPKDSPEWRAFLYAYEARIRAVLDDLEPQITRARLTAPGTPNGFPNPVSSR